MKKDKLEFAISECERFLKKAKHLLNHEGSWEKRGDRTSWPSTKCSAVKRASLDLSEALVDIRRSDYWEGWRE